MEIYAFLTNNIVFLKCLKASLRCRPSHFRQRSCPRVDASRRVGGLRTSRRPEVNSSLVVASVHAQAIAVSAIHGHSVAKAESKATHHAHAIGHAESHSVSVSQSHHSHASVAVEGL